MVSTWEMEQEGSGAQQFHMGFPENMVALIPVPPTLRQTQTSFGGLHISHIIYTHTPLSYIPIHSYNTTIAKNESLDRGLAPVHHQGSLVLPRPVMLGGILSMAGSETGEAASHEEFI